jgi:hypothetical protein
MSNYDHFVGTKPVSDQHAIDIAAMTAWLENNLPGFAGPLTLEMFKAASPTRPTSCSRPAAAT